MEELEALGPTPFQSPSYGQPRFALDRKKSTVSKERSILYGKGLPGRVGRGYRKSCFNPNLNHTLRTKWIYFLSCSPPKEERATLVGALAVLLLRGACL